MSSGSGAQYLPGGGTPKVQQWWGAYYAYVAVNQDPLAQGRVKLRVPQVFGSTTSGWADPVVPLEYVPEVGTPVIAMFLGGDPTHPVYLGNFAIPSGGGVNVTISSTAPANPNVGDIWYDSANGNAMNEWNGDQWITYQIGSDALADYAVQNAQLADGAVEAGNIADGTVVSGIVNGTTIEGASLVGDGIGQEILVYSGTPASGNLIMSVSSTQTTDDHGNAVAKGITAYGSGNGAITMAPFGSEALIALTPEYTNSGGYGVTVPQWVTDSFGSGAAEYFVSALYSGELGGVGNGVIQLYGGSADGSTSVAHVNVLGGPSGNMIIDINENGIQAADPSEANSDEIWHEMASFSSGYSHGSGTAPAYKLYADNTVGFAGTIAVGSSTTTVEIVGAFSTTTTTYYPPSTKHVICATSSGTYPYAQITITDTGELELSNPSDYQGKTIYLDGIRYPLDI